MILFTAKEWVPVLVEPQDAPCSDHVPMTQSSWWSGEQNEWPMEGWGTAPAWGHHSVTLGFCPVGCALSQWEGCQNSWVWAPRDRSKASLAAKRIDPSPDVCFPSLWLWAKSPSASSSKSDFCALHLKPHWYAHWISTSGGRGGVWAPVFVVVVLNKLSSESQIHKVWRSLINVLCSNYKVGSSGE